MQELSAWTRYCEQSPPNMEVFGELGDEVKNALVADSPMRVCKWRFPKIVNHITKSGGLAPCLFILVYIFL